jgi:hypothetical protein
MIVSRARIGDRGGHVPTTRQTSWLFSAQTHRGYEGEEKDSRDYRTSWEILLDRDESGEVRVRLPFP